MFSAKKSGVSPHKVCMLNLNSRDDCSFLLRFDSTVRTSDPERTGRVAGAGDLSLGTVCSVVSRMHTQPSL